MPKVPKIGSFHIFAISLEKHGDENALLPADKYESFYKALVPFWMCVSRLAQSTQNNKFAISLQYLKENGKNEVVFFSCR